MNRISVIFSIIIYAVFCVSPCEAYRVISLYPGHTDNIIALGGADMLVAVSDNDDPQTMPELPRLSMRIGAEAVIALQPDIVLTRALVDKVNPNLRRVLEQAGIRMETMEPPTWDEFPGYLRRLSQLLSLDADAAVSRLDDIRKRISAGVPPNAGKINVFVEATSKELHTCSPSSWAARLIELAGGVTSPGAEPLREGSALAKFGVERVLQLIGSGLDIYIIQNGAMNTSSSDDARARSWGSALKDVRVVVMPESLLSRPSLTGLERGGEMLLKIFYGE